MTSWRVNLQFTTEFSTQKIERVIDSMRYGSIMFKTRKISLDGQENIRQSKLFRASNAVISRLFFLSFCYFC